MLNILVIEDYTPDVVLIQAYLEEANLKNNFFHSTTLQEGLDIVKEMTIDIVLLDLSLGDIAGFNTLKKYLKEAPDVPVIVLTGLKNEVVGIQSVKAGAQDFLIKGEFDSKGLVKCIRYSLQRWKSKYAIVKQKKKYEDDLKRSDSVQKIAKFGNWEMDIVDRSMKWADEMFRIFGFQPQSFSPRLSDYLNYVHLEDRDKVDQYFDSVMQEAQQKRIEHRIIVEGTNIKYVMVHAQVSVDEGSDKIVLIGGVQDITERKKYSEIIQNNKKKDQPVNIFGTVLPQLRPNISLDLIHSLTQLAPTQKSPQLNSFWKDHVKTLLNSYIHLMQSSLLNDAIVRVEEKNIELRQLFNDLEDFYRNILGSKEKNLTIQFDKTFPVQVKTDANWMIFLFYIVQLLADNQRDINDPVTMKFELDGVPGDQENILVSIKGKFDKVSSISGFTEQSLLQYMESYPDKNHEILYLLSLYRLAFLLEGGCRVKSSNNNTIQIQLSFPINPTPEEGASDSAKNLGGRSTTILLAEDHSINRIKIKRMLSDWSDSIQIEEAENGKKAVEIFYQSKIDLVLMDLKMPIMDGMEAIYRIRTNDQIPIIALTNAQSDEEKEACLTAGANIYLSKPIKPETLYDAINSLLV